jgi:glutaconate CoA-transferase subunit B
MMITASARTLAGERICFVGVGLPNIVCNLAQRTVSPELQLVYESGVFGARPERLPLSIGDPTLVSGSTAVTSMFELFAFYLQAGLIDAAFLGGAQIDRFGNLNTTVIGDYASPKVRLPGSGGACEIAIHARRILVIMRQAQRSFVEKLHFRTSPGHSGDPAHDRARGWFGTGPTSVVTDLATFGFDEETGEMTLLTVHPGVSVDDVRANMGWEPRVSESLAQTPPPTEGELRSMSSPDDPDAPNADDESLPDVRGEPEPAWVEEIRRGRRRRAERLKAELGGLQPPPDGDGEEPPA